MANVVIELRISGLEPLIDAVHRLAAALAVAVPVQPETVHTSAEMDGKDWLRRGGFGDMLAPDAATDPRVDEGARTQVQPSGRRVVEEGEAKPVGISSEELPVQLAPDNTSREPHGKLEAVATPAAGGNPAPLSNGKGGSPPTTWTAERKTLLTRDYPRGASIDRLHAALSALPGAPIRREAIAVQAAKMGVKRPQPTVRKAPALAPVPRGPSPALDAGGCQVVTYATALKWAGERGLASRDTMELDVVNRKREQLGLPPFRIAKPEPRAHV